MSSHTSLEADFLAAGDSARPLQTDPGGDLVSFVDEVRHALRTIDPSDAELWRQAYEHGLREVYRRKDFDGLMEIAGFGAHCLDAQGHHQETLDQLSFAASMAQGVPEAIVYVLALRAPYAALMGNQAEARASLRVASESLTDGISLRTRLVYDGYSAMVACLTLEDHSLNDLATPIPICDREGLDWLASALRCWYIPYLFAIGERSLARPWIESLRVQAEVVGHPARVTDAGVFQAGRESVTGGPVDASLVDSAKTTINLIALWRVAVLRLHRALLEANSDSATEALGLLEEAAPTIHPAFVDGMDAFRALAAAYRGETVAGLKPPDQPSLVNCAAALAGGEAIAIAGTQEAAASWKAWFDACFPAIVKTTVEWPASTARVKGLLHVRAGAVKSGIQLLREAVRWSEDAGYPIEAALSRLQLAEVLTHANVGAVRGLDARKLRRQGWAALQELGVPPQSHAYAATSAVALSRDDRSLSPLTPREIEVLALLADGLSYKEVGARLGMSWRTAQLHASRIYEKLDVHGKMQAFEVARELKIL